jgi:hypothetical protein
MPIVEWWLCKRTRKRERKDLWTDISIVFWCIWKLETTWCSKQRGWHPTIIQIISREYEAWMMGGLFFREVFGFPPLIPTLAGVNVDFRGGSYPTTLRKALAAWQDCKTHSLSPLLRYVIHLSILFYYIIDQILLTLTIHQSCSMQPCIACIFREIPWPIIANTATPPFGLCGCPRGTVLHRQLLE